MRMCLEIEEEMKAIEEVRARFGRLDNDIPEIAQLLVMHHILTIPLDVDYMVNSIHRGVIYAEGMGHGALSYDVETRHWQTISQINYHGKAITYRHAGSPSVVLPSDKPEPFEGKRVEETDDRIFCNTYDALYRNEKGELCSISRLHRNLKIIHDGDHPYCVIFQGSSLSRYMGAVFTADETRQIIRLQDLWTGEEKVYVYRHNGNIISRFFMFDTQLYGCNKTGIYHIASGKCVRGCDSQPLFNDHSYFDGRYVVYDRRDRLAGERRRLEIYEIHSVPEPVTVTRT